MARRRLGSVQRTLCEVSVSRDYAAAPAEAPCDADETRQRQTVPSLIKWTGSKRSQAATIARFAPQHRRYFEPFLGGGALLFLLGNPKAIAGDIYPPLINLWQIVKEEPSELISNYATQWQLLQDNLPEYYYQVRERFNGEPNPFDLNFLTRTCVNGIIRFNNEGKFNNSFHLSRKGMQPDRFAKIVTQWHEAVQNVSFQCSDYADTLSDARDGDFVYLDPPYAGNRMRYTANLDLERFFRYLEDLNKRNVKWALSFDGHRGEGTISQTIPGDLYKRFLLVPSGNSAVGKVLNGPIEAVHESLYLNY
ncbi:MAG: DNA adenine methylase [Chloroflexi bacterium]|nr:DNA adenine methylase [Chloroflexota bacterium]